MKIIRTILVSLLSLAAPILVAQNSSPVLEEVIVVATKRESSLQDVAVAVSAVPDWVLSNNQIINSEQLTDVVPSLTLQKGATARESSFNIRGIGTQSYSVAAEPSVSTLIDGVVMGIAGQAFSQLADIERIEVLRGPQGTLFGKNSSAGAVHIITRKPARELEASIKAMLLEEDEYRFAGTISGPLSDSWTYRLTGSYIDDGGYIENLYEPASIDPTAITLNASEDTLGGREDTLLRGKLSWQLSDTLDVLYTGDWGKYDCDCGGIIYRSTSEPDRLLPVVVGEENIEVNVDGPNFSDVEDYGHALEINWDVGRHTLTSISAYRNWQQEFTVDVDGQPVVAEPLLLIQGGEDGQEQFSQELRLLSPADQSLSYVLGLYYFEQDTERTFFRSLFGLDSVTDLNTDKQNMAAFGEVTWNLSERWRFIVGGRYTYDEVDYALVREGLIPGPIEADDPNARGGTDDTDFSGKLVLQWDATDTTTTYISYVQGYKGAAYSIDATTDPNLIEVVKPETSDAFELGLKNRLFADRMHLNIAVFYTEFQNWQAQAFVPGEGDLSSGSFLLSNAGKVSTQGIEVDMTALLAENFTLFAALAYTDAALDEFELGPCNFKQQSSGVPVECGPTGAGVQDLSGGDMPYSPEWRFNISANYRFPLESMPFELGLNANYRWQSEMLFDITQDENTIQKSYGIVDLAAKMTSSNGRHSLSLFVKNVLDEFYAAGIVDWPDLFLPNAYVQAVPKLAQRTLGLEYRFEL